MGLSAGPVKHRAENYGDGNRHIRSRKPLMIISAAIVSVVIGIIATAGGAMLNYQPTRQHVEIEIAPRTP
jgi:hypothetical protein